MRLRIPVMAFCLTAAAILRVVLTVHAADVLSRLTNGDQHSLVLGTVVSVSDTTARFEVETIISGESLPSVVSVDIHGTSMETDASHMSLKPSDYAVLSLNKETAKYIVAWGCFKVSSLDITTLEIIEGPLPAGDLTAFQWYINSEGTEKDFYFIGTSAYVRHPDGTSTQIYPPMDKPADIKPAPASVEEVNNEVQASLGTSEVSINREEVESEIVAAPQGGEVSTSEWRYVLITVGLVLAGCFVYGIVKTKQRAG